MSDDLSYNFDTAKFSVMADFTNMKVSILTLGLNRLLYQ